MNKNVFLTLALLLTLVGCKNLHTFDNSLKMEVKPSNAKVKLVTHNEKEGNLKVEIVVEDYGTLDSELKGNKSRQVHITLEKPNFLTQKYMIYEPVKKETITLPIFSLNKNSIGNAFQGLSKLYDIKMIYPTYIPPGFKFKEAEIQSNVTELGTTSMVYITWTSNGQIKSSNSSSGTQFIQMRILLSGKSWKRYGRGIETSFETIRVNKDLEAKLFSSRLEFMIDGHNGPWEIITEGLNKKELVKIIEGIKLTSNGHIDNINNIPNPDNLVNNLRHSNIPGTRLESIAEAEEKSGLKIKAPERLFGKNAQIFLSENVGAPGLYGVMISYSNEREPKLDEGKIFIYPNPELVSYDYIMDQVHPPGIVNSLRDHKGHSGYAQERTISNVGKEKDTHLSLVEWSDNGTIYMVHGPSGMRIDKLIPIADTID